MIRVSFLCVFLIFCVKVNSQNVEIGIMTFPNLVSSNKQYENENKVLSLNGGGLKLGYQQAYKQSQYNYILGGEFSFTDWGTQAISRIGANTLFNNAFGLEVILLNGLALYIDNPAYVFGATANVFYLISIKNKKRIKLFAGLRFSQNSKYKTIGNYQFIDLPFGISWLFGNAK